VDSHSNLGCDMGSSQSLKDLEEGYRSDFQRVKKKILE